MALNKEARRLAAEIEEKVASRPDAQPEDALIARGLGFVLVCVANIADALERAHPANPLKTESDDGPR